MNSDEMFMDHAFEEAKEALAEDEVPVGAVLTREATILAKGHNQRESQSDPTAHAEIIAIREAAKVLGTWRLNDCTLYVTKEPCPMCAGAMVQARLGRLVYGAADAKAGAAGTLLNVTGDKRLNHQVEVTAGVARKAAEAILQEFFRKLR